MPLHKWQNEWSSWWRVTETSRWQRRPLFGLFDSEAQEATWVLSWCLPSMSSYLVNNFSNPDHPLWPTLLDLVSSCQKLVVYWPSLYLTWVLLVTRGYQYHSSVSSWTFFIIFWLILTYSIPISRIQWDDSTVLSHSFAISISLLGRRLTRRYHTLVSSL